jgi:hypothetical protein
MQYVQFLILQNWYHLELSYVNGQTDFIKTENLKIFFMS